MRLTLVFFLLLSGVSGMVVAQKKTDLIEDLKALNELVGRKEDEISRLKKSLVAEETLNQTYLFEIENLKTTNSALMKRLSNFTSQSVSNISSIGDQIESMRVLEKQDQALRQLIIEEDSTLIETVKRLAPVVSKANGMLINRGRIEVSFSTLEYALKDSLHLDPKLVRIDSALRVITDLELVITGAFQPIIIDSITMDKELIAPKFYEVFSKKFDLDQNRIKLDPTVNNDTVTISLRPSLQRSYERIRSILKR
jgi:hypothetical protein